MNEGDPYMSGNVSSLVGVVNKPKEVLLCITAMSTVGVLNKGGKRVELPDAPHFRQHCPCC